MFLSTSESAFLHSSLSLSSRLDGRSMLDSRSIELYFISNSQLELHLGRTVVITRVFAELIEPREDRPNEGFLFFNVIGRGGDGRNNVLRGGLTTNEICRVLEKGIKNSKALDVESLGVLSGKKVWSIKVESEIINNDGNLIDAIFLSNLLGLVRFRKPLIKIEKGGDLKIEEEKLVALSVTHLPIAFTYGFFNQAEQIVCDPTIKEEHVMEGRITIVMNIYKDICLIQKPGGAPLSPLILEKLVKVTETKISQITNLIRKILSKPEENSLFKLKEENRVVFNWNREGTMEEEIIEEALK